MFRFKSYAIPVGIVGAIIAASIISSRATAVAFVIYAVVSTVYSARFGRLKQILPGLRVIDYVVYLTVMSSFLYFFWMASAQNGAFAFIVLGVVLVASSFYFLFRFQAITGRASFSFGEFSRRGDDDVS
jgi:hypothetical protein